MLWHNVIASPSLYDSQIIRKITQEQKGSEGAIPPMTKVTGILAQLNETLRNPFVTRYDQKMYIYVTNAYDQNVSLGRGTRYDIVCDEENCDDILPHMLDEVDIISVTPDGGLQILVRDAMYEKPLEEQYDKDYVTTWKNHDKSTRPFRFSAELEDMQPVK